MEYTLLLIAAVAVLGSPSVHGAAKLPADIERCKRNDPKLNECLHDALQKAMPQITSGIPKLGGIPLEPLEVTYIEVNQGSGPISINLKFRNLKIHGLSKTVVGTVRADLDKYELQIEVVAPHLEFEGDYEIDGKILVLPVTGKGRFNLTTINLKGTGGPKGVSIKKNGQDFFDVKEYIMTLETPAELTVHFENLFNGDKALGDAMNIVLNENWKELWDGVLKDALRTTVSQIFKEYSSRIFSKVPYDDVFLK